MLYWFEKFFEFIDHNDKIIVALSGIVVAWFTGTLWWSTKKLWGVTKTAADAAGRTARASIALQLPIIRIKPDNLDHGDSSIDGVETEYCGVHAVILSNLGVTKCFPKEIIYGWIFGDKLPAEPSYKFSDSFLPNFILEPDPKTTPRRVLTGTMLLGPGQWSEICKGNNLWFYCALIYDDFMEETHSHGFCWRWSHTGMGMDWRPDDTPNYNRKT